MNPGVTIFLPFFFTVDLSRPSVQRQRLLPSSTQQYGSVPAQCCHPPGAVARPGEPGSARPKPEGLLRPAGSRQGTGTLHPLPLPQDVSAALLHRPGRTAGLHICLDDHPRLHHSSIIICRYETEPRSDAVPTEWNRRQQTSSTDESKPSQVQNGVEDSVQSASQPKKKWDEGGQRRD